MVLIKILDYLVDKVEEEDLLRLLVLRAEQEIHHQQVLHKETLEDQPLQQVKILQLLVVVEVDQELLELQVLQILEVQEELGQLR